MLPRYCQMYGILGLEDYKDDESQRFIDSDGCIAITEAIWVLGPRDKETWVISSAAMRVQSCIEKVYDPSFWET